MDPLLRTVLARLSGAQLRLDGPSPLVTTEEAVSLAELPVRDTLDLITLGGTVRATLSPSFFNCGIVNAKSGSCPENCAFCAQSAHYRTDTPVYPFVSTDVLVERAAHAKACGDLRFGIVTSGTALDERDADRLCRAVERIVREVGINVCGSLGILTPERARRYAEAGMTRYHHNLETARSFFPRICSTHAYEEDLESLHAARTAGMQVCSGGILGLGESRAQRVELAFTLAEANVDSIPVNLLNAIPGTPLEAMPKLSPQEALRSIALFRIVNPLRDILIAGGRGHVLGTWQSWLYAAGANGMMTGDYLTIAGAEADFDAGLMRTLGVRD